MLDDTTQQNGSKFAIFYIYENPKMLFTLFISFHVTTLLYFFPLMNALVYVKYFTGFISSSIKLLFLKSDPYVSSSKPICLSIDGSHPSQPIYSNRGYFWAAIRRKQKKIYTNKSSEVYMLWYRIIIVNYGKFLIILHILILFQTFQNCTDHGRRPGI